MNWLATTGLLTFPRRFTGEVIRRCFFESPESSKIFALIKQIKKETDILLSYLEAYQLYVVAKATEKIIGDIAEVGVYKGGSAKLICETLKNKPIYLFDTFEGLPDTKEDDDQRFYEGRFFASVENVRKYLKDYPNAHLYKGLFPSSAVSIINKRFSFVHLDVDIYESTLNSLMFFYPRMSKGGIIMSHDYVHSKGVKKAFDEFFGDKPEVIVELPACDQCLVVVTEEGVN